MLYSLCLSNYLLVMYQFNSPEMQYVLLLRHVHSITKGTPGLEYIPLQADKCVFEKLNINNGL